MAILVDELREYPGVALPFTTWCHMATDGGFDELHAFAGRLGLRRAWFQRDHYDLPPHGRAAAVALGAEEVATHELLLRMTGPRGDRMRRRALVPGGVTWLRGGDGPAVLRYPARALVVIAGPPGAGTSALAARVVDASRVPLLDPEPARSDLAAALAAGRGAVVVTGAPPDRPGPAVVAGGSAHLVVLEGGAGPGWAALRRTLAETQDPAPFVTVTVLDAGAADRLHGIRTVPG